ncbi:MAG: M20 family metallo-hydrolase [Bacteroidales bacterium]
MVEELTYNAIDLLKAMISTPSISREEGEVSKIIETFIATAGYQPQRIGNNIYCLSKKFDSARPTILLNSHMDTVKAVQGWSYDPFSATEVDDHIYGLGSNDAGASLVSLLATFIYIDQLPQSYNLIFLASAEEEISGKGGIELALQHLPHFDVAIVGEPTDMQPAIAEKGLMVLDGVIHGISGHAARNEGDNAISKAITVIEQLHSFNFPKKSETLGDIKISVTQINAGTQHNVIPDRCNIVVDIRTTDAYSNIETMKLITDSIPNCEFTPRSTRLNPSNIDIEHPIVKRLIRLGATPFGSPTLSDQAQITTPSLKLGVGSSSRSHTADEYITKTEIREAIRTYTTLLNELNL